MTNGFDDFYAIISAGGTGTRLWPLSRERRPKFFYDLLGQGRTLIQSTYDRLAQICGMDHVCVSTGDCHVATVREQLPEIGADQIFAEPAPRDSTAAIALATAVLARRNGGDIVVGSFAADHVIRGKIAFIEAVRQAVETARAGYVTTIGIAASRPSTAFGYIHEGPSLAEQIPNAPSACIVERFVEKPNAATAQAYLSTGEYRWNAGMFVMRADVLLDHLHAHKPQLARAIDAIADAIIDTVRRAGITGMGGAAFPTDVKLMPKNADEIEYVIANGCECEPYITCDDRLMQDENRAVVDGLKLVLELFPHAKGVIAIEDNKPEAIKAMEAVCAGENRMYVQPVRTKYPQGGERNLISVIAERDLRVGMLPAELGCVVCNVGTLNAIYNACLKNEPLMERYFTITGDAVNQPKTVIAKIGTSVEELIEAAGGFKDGVTPKKVLFGGPMMGLALSDLTVPVAKNNNALTILAEDPVEKAQEVMTACIRCGRCSRACPIRLIPQQMAVACEKHDLDQFEKLYGMDCFQCGTCTYVCPAKRPLMQLFKEAKAAVIARQRAATAAAQAAAAKEGGK